MRGSAERVIRRHVVQQPGHVAALHEPGQLVRLAVLVEGDVPHVQHRHARPQPQQPGFLGPGHPRADFLPQAGYDVTLVLQDAELVRHRISPATRITMLSCSYSYSLLA
jgi:hypothetical protein